MGVLAELLAATSLPWVASAALATSAFLLSLFAVRAGQVTDREEADAASTATAGCLAVVTGIVIALLLLVGSPMPWWASLLIGFGAVVVLALGTPLLSLLLHRALDPARVPAGAAAAIAFVFGALTSALLGWGAGVDPWVAVPVGILVWPAAAFVIAWLGATRPPRPGNAVPGSARPWRARRDRERAQR